MEPYLNHMIDEEQKIMAANPLHPRTKHDSLVKMKNNHRENVRILTEAIANKSQDAVRLEDIAKYRDQLFQLKHTGAQFRQMLHVSQSAQSKLFQHWLRDPIDLNRTTGPLAFAASNASSGKQKKKSARKWFF